MRAAPRGRLSLLLLLAGLLALPHGAAGQDLPTVTIGSQIVDAPRLPGDPVPPARAAEVEFALPPPPLPPVRVQPIRSMMEEDTERIEHEIKTQSNIVTDYVASVNWRRTFNNTIFPLAALAGWFDTASAPLPAGQYAAAA